MSTILLPCAGLLPDSLSDLLYNDHSIHGDNTEDGMMPFFKVPITDGSTHWVTISTLCQKQALDQLMMYFETEQQQWLDMREQAALDTSNLL